MEVLIISREAIKPSSPTPPHLKTFKLSLLDKSYKTTFIPIVSYYSIEHPDDEVIVERIKLALAKALTRYYPLAGRLGVDGCTIDCNDKGVAFATARVNCRLADLLKDPKVLPLMPSMCTDDDEEPAQIGIQLSVFECGGIAISMYVCHLICDATSTAAFMKCWSEISRFEDRDRGDIDPPVAYPSFPGVELFTTFDDDGDDVIMSTPYVCPLGEGKCVLQRFVFHKDSISALREKARREDVLLNPTRAEAVSTFIWKHCMAAAAQVRGVRQPSKMAVVAELRRRMAPLLSENSCGNIFLRATIESRNDDDISGLISSFRASIKEDVLEVIPTLMKNEGGGGRAASLQYMEKFRADRKDTNLNQYLFSSWCSLGFTDIDFGWGKPVWFSHIWMDDLPYDCRNIFIIVDGQGGEKIELWLLLDDREMNVLENNQDFLAYASLNPPILI